MPFPSLDPVIFEIGPFALRWYALAYIAGLMLGWRYVILLSRSARPWPQGPVAGREAAFKCCDGPDTRAVGSRRREGKLVAATAAAPIPRLMVAQLS